MASPAVFRGLGGQRAAVAVVLLAVAVMLAGVSCARGASGSASVGIDLKVTTEKAVGPATVEVLLQTPDGKPVDGADVLVRGDMNHAGMKPVLSPAKPAGGGRYVTEDFRFTMAGDWILSAEVTVPGGEKVERTFEVSGVARK